jgi:hypothetical protein
MRKASELNFDSIRHFSKSEWPDGALEQMEAKVILTLAEVRAKLPADHRMQPSPVLAAHVRQAGNSRHSTQAGKRLSDATDIFIPGGWAHAHAAWREFTAHPDVGGLGWYLDRWVGTPSNITPMIHIDCRPQRTMWVCTGGVYTYHHTDPAEFFRLLGSRV